MLLNNLELILADGGSHEPLISALVAPLLVSLKISFIASLKLEKILMLSHFCYKMRNGNARNSFKEELHYISTLLIEYEHIVDNL